MRHDHHRHAFFGKFDHHVQHFVNHFRVECRCRFVEKHGDGFHGQRACDRHTLLLTTGKLRRKLILVFDKTDTIQKFQAFFMRSGLGPAKYFGLRHYQILSNAHMRKKFEVLKHHSHPRAQLGEVGFFCTYRYAIDPNLAFLKRLKPVDGLD